MAGTGRLVDRNQITDWSVPLEGVNDSGHLSFPLRATPLIFVLLVPGGNNRSLVMRSTPAIENVQIAPRPHLIAYRLATGPSPAAQILTSALVHARTLGAPAVSPQLRLTGIAHARVLGAPTVVPAVVIPPVIPPPVTPTTPSVTPRNLRSVRRRNVEERD